MNLSLRGDGLKTFFFPVSERDFRDSLVCVYTETGILSFPEKNLVRNIAKWLLCVSFL